MAIEAVKTAGVTYQGSTAQTEDHADNVASAGSVSNTASAAQQAVSTATVSPAAGQVDGVIRKIRDAKDPDKKDQDKVSPIGMDEATDRKIGSGKDIRKAVDEINKNAVNSEAIFGIHEKTNRVMIKIIDKDSKKVLKEYPPEKTLDMIAKVWEMAGLMVDEKM